MVDAKPDLIPPIFLLGSGRTGTNLIQRILTHHPGLEGWVEPRTVWTYPDPGRLHDRFDEKDATKRAESYIHKRFRSYQHRHGNRRIFEKTPSNIMRIPYVHTLFPDSPLIYIIRAPFPTIQSFERLWRKPPDSSRMVARLLETPSWQLPFFAGRFLKEQIDTRLFRRKHVQVRGVRYPGIYEDRKTLTVEQIIAKQWVACAQQADQDLAKINPSLVMRLKFEEFVADPLNHVEAILKHVKMPVSEHLAKIVRQQVDPNRPGQWGTPPAEMVRQCLPIVGEEAAKQGYPLNHLEV